MLREHASHAYDAKRLWLYLDAKSEFVASASWKEFVRLNGGFGGPSVHKQTTKVLCAESDILDELRAWGAAQIAAGAETVLIHRTWLIPEGDAPVGHRLHGKRENAFLEGLETQNLRRAA